MSDQKKGRDPNGIEFPAEGTVDYPVKAGGIICAVGDLDGTPGNATYVRGKCYYGFVGPDDEPPEDADRADVDGGRWVMQAVPGATSSDTMNIFKVWYMVDEETIDATGENTFYGIASTQTYCERNGIGAGKG